MSNFFLFLCWFLVDCRSTELGCLFQKVIKQSIKSLQQSLNVFFFFYQLKRLFWTGKTDNCFSLCQWKIFILFFYCQVVLGKKKNQYLFSIWTISISRWHHVGLSMWYFHTILTLFLLELQIEDSVACRQLDGGHDSS